MNKFTLIFAALLLLMPAAHAQVPLATAVQIAKAEDARRYDATLEGLMKSPHKDVRKRAALAAGRIGDENAIPALTGLLENDPSGDVRAMAAFALGEIESIKAADAVLNAFKTGKTRTAQAETRPVGSVPDVIARLVEAAGKIAAANPKDAKSTELGAAIVETLNTEYTRAKIQDTPTVLLALTAVLRARPDGADKIVPNFLTNYDARVRADAANTLARLKSKAAAEALRKMVTSDTDPIARANAARALGNMQDKDSLNELLSAAVEDKDSRVRVSAITALGSLGDARAAKHLLERGDALYKETHKHGAPNSPPKLALNPPQRNELLLIATALGRLLPNSEDEAAIGFLSELRKADLFRSAETEVALATVAPQFYFRNEVETLEIMKRTDWHARSAIIQAYARLNALPRQGKNEHIVNETHYHTLKFVEGWFWNENKAKYSESGALPIPELLRAMAAYTKENSGIFGPVLDREEDPFIRAAAAELLGDGDNKSKEVIESLNKAFAKALLTDKHDNDAQLAIMDALYKLDKKEAVGTLLVALSSPDYLVRKKAFELLSDKGLQKDFPGIPTSLENARAKHKDQVLPYAPVFGTKLGQVLNTDIDYRRALSRRNGSVKAVLTTEKGTFTIAFYPEDAPLTVDNFIKLARSGYFNGLEVHRVVPNFVMQDGDPRGDGNGGRAGRSAAN